MGHTLVAVFSDESERKIRELLKKSEAEDACKIPFGRDCDRDAADLILKHHITLFHWKKEDDAVYLNRLSSIQNIPPCTITVVKPICIADIDNSYVICLEVAASSEFSKMMHSVGQCLGKSPSRFLHITLDATQDSDRANRIYTYLKSMECFPLELNISGLDLYKIWKPVKLINNYPVLSL